jgi:hypothetical protein
MRGINSLIILLFACILVTFAVATPSEYGLVKQPVEFRRVLRGKKGSSKGSKSRGKKGGFSADGSKHSGKSKASRRHHAGSDVAKNDVCPEESPAFSEADALCDIQDQLCIYTNDTDFPGGSSTTRDECTCKSAKWDCVSTATSGISMISCPEESPIVTNEAKCAEDLVYPTPCIYEYAVDTGPEYTSTETDECTCNSGAWECRISVSYLLTETEYRYCPHESPLVSNETTCDPEHYDSLCVFEYITYMPDATCTNMDECTCMSAGIWDCSASVDCVSSNPP